MSHQNCALSSLIKRACRKSCSNFQRGNEEVERWKFGNQSIAFLKPIPNHSSDVNQSFTHWIIARQETKVEIGSRLPRHKSLSAWQSMVTKAEAWSPREESVPWWKEPKSMPGTSVKVQSGYLESYLSQMVLLHSKLNWKMDVCGGGIKITCSSELVILRHQPSQKSRKYSFRVREDKAFHSAYGGSCSECRDEHFCCGRTVWCPNKLWEVLSSEKMTCSCIFVWLCF